MDAALMEPTQSESATYGTFIVGDEEFCLAAHNIREVVEFPSDMVPFPDSTSHVIGMFSLRENVVPVVDMRAKLGIEAPAQPGGRIAIVDCQGHLVGALFDTTGEVLEVQQPEIREVRTRAHQPVQAIIQSPGTRRLIRVLDPSSFEGVPVVPCRDIQGDEATLERKHSQFIIVRIGDVRLAIEMEHSFEVHKALELTRSIPYFLDCTGTVTLRDAKVGMLDIRKRLGLVPTKAPPPLHVFVHHSEAVVAFPVDEVVAVLSVPSSDIVSVPLLNSASNDQPYSQVVREGDGDVLLLDVVSLFAQCSVDPLCATGIGRGLLLSPIELEEDITSAAYLTFEVGTRTLGIDTTHIREIREYPKTLMLPPGARPELHGLMNVRGDIIAILDTGRRYDSKSVNADEARRIIIVEAGGQRFGLLVDCLGEIIQGQDTEDYSAALHLLRGSQTKQQRQDVHRALRLNSRHKRDVLLLLDPDALLRAMMEPETQDVPEEPLAR